MNVRAAVGDSLSTSLASFTPAWAALLTDHNVSDGAVRLYLILAHHARPGKPVVYPGQDRLCRYMNCSLDTIQRHLAALVGAGWISVERRGARKPNRYHIIIPTPVDSPEGDAANLRSDAANLRSPNRSRKSRSIPLVPQSKFVSSCAFCGVRKPSDLPCMIEMTQYPEEECPWK